VRLSKLERMVERTGLSSGEIVPYLAALLAIPTGQRYPPLDLEPSELKERTITALIAMTIGAARQAPLLMIVEDAHWIDPTSLDLTNRLVDRLRHAPILWVTTFRPEFAAPWIGNNVTTLALNRLERDQAVTMIDRMTSGKRLPANVLDQIVTEFKTRSAGWEVTLRSFAMGHSEFLRRSSSPGLPSGWPSAGRT